jgi:hypothetical protein
MYMNLSEYDGGAATRCGFTEPLQRTHAHGTDKFCPCCGFSDHKPPDAGFGDGGGLSIVIDGGDSLSSVQSDLLVALQSVNATSNIASTLLVCCWHCCPWRCSTILCVCVSVCFCEPVGGTGGGINIVLDGGFNGVTNRASVSLMDVMCIDNAAGQCEARVLHRISVLASAHLVYCTVSCVPLASWGWTCYSTWSGRRRHGNLGPKLCRGERKHPSPACYSEQQQCSRNKYARCLLLRSTQSYCLECTADPIAKWIAGVALLFCAGQCSGGGADLYIGSSNGDLLGPVVSLIDSQFSNNTAGAPLLLS